MKKLFLLSIMFFSLIACSSTTKDVPETDIFTELRNLNTVDEISLDTKAATKHTEYKNQINDRLNNFLSNEVNKTNYPSIEKKKLDLASEIINLNMVQEASLSPEDLEALRSDRATLVDELELWLSRGSLFKNIEALNSSNLDASSKDEEKQINSLYKEDLNKQLVDLVLNKGQKSEIPSVEQRKQEVVDLLRDLNSFDETILSEEELSELRQERTDYVDQLIGLLDGSLVPQEEEPVVEEPPVVVEPEVAPQPPVPTPIPEEPKPAVVPPVPQEVPRGDIFEEILKLNTINEAQMPEAEKNNHKEFKESLNTELIDLLNNSSNTTDELVIKAKDDLLEELVQLNRTDESTLQLDELDQLRGRRAKIIEQLKDILNNGTIHTATEFDIISNESEGVNVEKETDETFNVFFTDLLFAFNKTDLRQGVVRTLDNIIKLLKEKENLSVIIGGHSDNIGPEWAKAKIATGRAFNAKAYLLRAGISEDRIILTKGYSDTQPIATPFTSENRRKNRRVEIRVTSDPSIIEEARNEAESTERSVAPVLS